MDPHTLFLLDDHADTHLLVRYMLADPYSVACCTTCAEARMLLGAQPFDLLLIDIRLPDGSGIDVLHHVRSQPLSHNAGTPAVAITARGLPGGRAMLLDEGFDAYLAKPFQQSDLIRTVRQQIALA